MNNLDELLLPLAAQVIRKCRKRNIRSVVIYGAGSHTAALIPIWRKLCGPEIKWIVVTEPTKTKHYLMDIEIVSMNDLPTTEFQAVVLSSKTYEDDLYKTCRAKFPNIVIFKLWNQPDYYRMKSKLLALMIAYKEIAWDHLFEKLNAWYHLRTYYQQIKKELTLQEQQKTQQFLKKNATIAHFFPFYHGYMLEHSKKKNPPLLFSEIQKLKSLHNRFKGERIFLLGNGPSLNQTPLQLLKNEFTFGVNRIYLMYDKIDWRPNFYSCFDLRVLPDISHEINTLIKSPYRFFATRHKPFIQNTSEVYWHYHFDGDVSGGLDDRFEPEVIYGGFGGGGTIMTHCIQLAFYMGFDPIYLLGVDASYTVPNTVKQSGPDVFKNGVLLNLESTADDDPNHFDSRYFGKGRKWHNPNVDMMLKGFYWCREAMEKRGRRLFNATVGGKLDVIPRVEFKSLF